MRKIAKMTSMLAFVGALGACSGGGRNQPDEFAVSRQAPLVIPPDYSLKAPAPGTAGAGQTGSEAEVLQAMFGGSAPRSRSETNLISQAGRSDLGIRTQVGDPDTPTVNKGAMTPAILRAPEGDGNGVQASIPK